MNAVVQTPLAELRQGLQPAGGGFRTDVRFDYFNQSQLRSGTGTVDRGRRVTEAAFDALVT